MKETTLEEQGQVQVLTTSTMSTKIKQKQRALDIPKILIKKGHKGSRESL